MARKKAIKLEEVKPAEVKGLLRDVPLENPVELTSVTRFSADHILRTSYNPTSKAVVLEDVPAGLKSEFTLGEGGIELADVECSFVLGDSAIELGVTSASANLIGFLEQDGKLGLYDAIEVISGGESVSFKLPKNVNNILQLFAFVPDTGNVFTTPQIPGAHYVFDIDGDCLGDNGDIVRDGTITLTLESDD